MGKAPAQLPAHQLAAWLNDATATTSSGHQASPSRLRSAPKEVSSTKPRKAAKPRTPTRSRSKGRESPSKVGSHEWKRTSPSVYASVPPAGKDVDIVDPFLKQFQSEQEEFDAWKAGIDRVLSNTAAATQPRSPTKGTSAGMGSTARKDLEKVNKSAAAEEARRQLLSAIETARALEIETESEVSDVDVDTPLIVGGSQNVVAPEPGPFTSTRSKPDKAGASSQKKSPRLHSAKDGCSSTCRLRMRGHLKTIKALQAGLRERENTIKTLKLTVESKQKRISTLESMPPVSERGSGPMDSGKGAKDMDSLRRAVQGLRKAEGEHVRHIKELEDEVRQLKRKDTRSQEVNAGIISKLKEQEKMLHEAVNTNTGLEATISQLQRRVEGMRKKCSKLEDENEKLAASLDSSRVELNMKVRQYEALRKTVDRKKDNEPTHVDEILDGMNERAKELGSKTTSKREAWMESSSSDDDERTPAARGNSAANSGISSHSAAIARFSSVLSEFQVPNHSGDANGAEPMEDPDDVALTNLPPIPPAPLPDAPVPYPAPVRAPPPEQESALTPLEFDELIKADTIEDSHDFIVHESIMSKYEKLRSKYAKLSKMV